MKKTIALLALALLLGSQPALAAKAKKRYAPANSPWYLGIKGGFMDAGIDGDDAINMGLDLGYRNNTYLATEIEYTDTFIEGDTRNGNPWEVQTLSVFAALRSNTPVKVKGKIGLTNIDWGYEDEMEISMGFGVGFWALGGLTEIEFTKLGDGTRYGESLDFFSFGVQYFY